MCFVFHHVKSFIKEGMFGLMEADINVRNEKYSVVHLKWGKFPKRLQKKKKKKSQV